MPTCTLYFRDQGDVRVIINDTANEINTDTTKLLAANHQITLQSIP